LASPLGAVGFFEASTTIGARIDDDPQIVVQGLDLERTLVRAVDQVAALSAQLGLKGPTVLAAALQRIVNVGFHRPGPRTGGWRSRRSSAPLGTAGIESFFAPLRTSARWLYRWG
jgi:hypothetical protein